MNLILVDEMMADFWGSFSNFVVKALKIDRLASCGVRFEKCIATRPICMPCRASILTGCYPSTVRSRIVGCVSLDDPRFITRAFTLSGYHCSSIRKIHLAPQSTNPKGLEASRRTDGSFGYYGFTDVDLVNGHGSGCFSPDYKRFLSLKVSGFSEKS